MNVDRLAWDIRLEHGQSRTIDDDHVEHLVNSLYLRPPREPVRVTLWENEVDKKFYILSGQHLCRAVQRVREERLQQGMKLDHWHKMVRADILKFNTPHDIRRIVAGAENASTKVMRVTTVSECLRMFMADNSNDSLSDRILRAVQQSGLSISEVSPVCFPYHTQRVCPVSKQ